MLKTIIKSVDLNHQRYETLGDYYMKNKKRVFSITETGNNLYDDLIFIHEFIEEVLTRNKGILEPKILKYDLEFDEKIKKGEVTLDAEPGDQLDCPYRKEHRLASDIERLILDYLNIPYEKYNNTINKIFMNGNN